jgi:hypothetical protein
MYATEYDLLVAEHRCRDRRQEMRSIRLAQAAQAGTTGRPGLLDRLIALTGRAAHVQTPHHKAGAAA